MHDQTAVLACRSLRKSYQQGPKKLVVLDGIDLNIHVSEHVAILGRSGSGKSTLLHLLGGLSDADSGTVIVKGRNMTKAKPSERARIRNQQMGFVYQFHHLLPEFDAVENVAMPLLLGGTDPEEAQNRASRTLEAVGLLDRAKHRQSELSGGERQRVAIARALVTRPAIVLADEPTGNLDRESADQVFSLMRDLSQAYETAFVVVTHDESMADNMQRKVRLVDGQLAKQE